MKVIISGCGKIGTTILTSLLKEKHEIVVIDIDPKVVESVTNRFDVIAICGNGTSHEVLKQAGASKAELFISVTSSDEFNMLSCFVAKKMGAEKTVARIRNSEYNNRGFGYIKTQLDIDMIINPELLTAQTLYNILRLPSATNVESFSASDTEMIELTLKNNSPLLGVPLYELRKKFPFNFLISVVRRGETAYVPNGSFILEEGDEIGVLTANSDVTKLVKAFDIEQKPVKSVMIVGGSKTAYYLSELLLKSKYSVKIIDKKNEKCLEFSEKLNGATIVLGDGMSQEILLEEGITSTDAFLALTNKDEENVIMSIYSKSKNVQKAIAKINRDELLALSKNLGLETVVTSKYLVADVLVRYARALENSKGSTIKTLYSLLSGKAEAAEFEVLPDFKFLNVPIKELKIDKDVLIASIIRGNSHVIPGGDDVILEGDNVIVITAGHSLYDLSDVISRK